MGEEVRTVAVPAARFARWVENFESRHGDTSLAVREGALHGVAADGSTFAADPPLGQQYVGEADVDRFLSAIEPPETWGLLLVRKGGFAVALMNGAEIAEHKIGQRHVQGRTKAGGQSQQRFARRRDNQARQAYEAAADHAARLLGARRVAVVTGGDHAAVDEVLADPRLRRVSVTAPWLAVPEPRRAVLDRAISDALSLRVEVRNA